MLEPFGDDAQLALSFAGHEARVLNHRAIHTVDCILSLLRVRCRVTAMLDAESIDPVSLRDQIRDCVPRGTPGVQSPIMKAAGCTLTAISRADEQSGASPADSFDLLQSLLRDRHVRRAMPCSALQAAELSRFLDAHRPLEGSPPDRTR